MNLALSNSAYGLNGFAKGIGPIGRGLFWLALYAGLLYWLYVVSKDLYKAMQLPRLRDYKDFENKVLLWMHNSFWQSSKLYLACWRMEFICLRRLSE